MDRRRFGEQVWFGGEYEMFVGPMAPVASPNAYMLAVLSSEGAWSTTGHKDEVLDALILAQAGEYEPEERRRLVVEAQRLALGERLPVYAGGGGVAVGLVAECEGAGAELRRVGGIRTGRRCGWRSRVRVGQASDSSVPGLWLRRKFSSSSTIVSELGISSVAVRASS